MCLTLERWCCLTWLRIVLEEPFDFWPVCSMWKFWQKSRLILPCSIMCSLQWYFLSSWPCLAWELNQQKRGSEFSNPPSPFFCMYKNYVNFLILLMKWHGNYLPNGGGQEQRQGGQGDRDLLPWSSCRVRALGNELIPSELRSQLGLRFQLALGLRASVSGRSSEVIKDESFVLKQFGRYLDNGQCPS